MKYRGVEMKLRKIIEKRLSEGWVVTPGQRFVDTRNAACCALGSIVADEYETSTLPTIQVTSKVLGISESEAWAISNGFEEDTPPCAGLGDDPRFIEIGARIRRDYCEWQS